MRRRFGEEGSKSLVGLMILMSADLHHSYPHCTISNYKIDCLQTHMSSTITSSALSIID